MIRWGTVVERKRKKYLVTQEVGVVCSHMTISIATYLVTQYTTHCHMFLHCGTPLFWTPELRTRTLLKVPNVLS